MEKQIEKLNEIIDQLNFLDLDKKIIESEIFEKIAVQIYNGWAGQTWIDRINEKIKFFIEILPKYSNVYWKDQVKTLEVLANAKNCNYTNWFQEANIPKNFLNVLVYKNAEEFFEKHPDKKYICPKCNGESSNAYECTCKGCDWKVYGLFWDLGKWVYIFFTDKMEESPIPQNIFKPINL